MALTLQVDEFSGINPSVTWLPSSIFSIGGSLDISSKATRIDKLAYFYTIRELKQFKKQGQCPPNYYATLPSHPPGSLLIQSDLRLGEWLQNVVDMAAIGQYGLPTGPDTPLKQNAFSHHVKFHVVSAGGIEPIWILRRFAINDSGPLFTTSRERLHSLEIVFGPRDPNQKDKLAPTAQDLFLASQIDTAFSNALRNR